MALNNSFGGSSAKDVQQVCVNIDGRTSPLGNLCSDGVNVLTFHPASGAGAAECAAFAVETAVKNPARSVRLEFSGTFYPVTVQTDALTLAQEVTGMPALPHKGTFTLKQMVSPETMKNAIESDDIGALRTVLTCGVYVDARLDGGYTAIAMAASKGQKNFVKLLIEHKANVNLAAGDGATPLMMAARSGSVETARILLDAGARVDAADAEGHNALGYARGKEMKDFLESSYAAEVAERLRQKAEAAVAQSTVLQRDIAPMHKLTFKKP